MEIEHASEGREREVALSNPVQPPPAPHTNEWTMSVAVGIMQLAGLASIGAGAIHAAAAGLHAEHTTLARLFVGVAVAQIGVGLLAIVKGGRVAALLVAAVNLGAVAAWGTTRLWGITWIEGLEVAEAAQFTDTACATLGAIAAAAAAVALARRATGVATVRLGMPAFSVGAVALAAMLVGANHVHSHGDADSGTGSEIVSAGGAPSVSADGALSVSADDHDHDHEAASGGGAPGQLVAAYIRRVAPAMGSRPTDRRLGRRGGHPGAGAARHCVDRADLDGAAGLRRRRVGVRRWLPLHR